MTGFVELDALTNFTFLEGASHPEEMVVQAKAIGLAAIGVADRNSLAGVVRAHRASKKHVFPILVGCRLTFRDGAELIVYPRDRAAYGRLCRLLSLGKSRIEEPVFEGDNIAPFPLEGGRAGDGGERAGVSDCPKRRCRPLHPRHLRERAGCSPPSQTLPPSRGKGFRYGRSSVTAIRPITTSVATARTVSDCRVLAGSRSR